MIIEYCVEVDGTVVFQQDLKSRGVDINGELPDLLTPVYGTEPPDPDTASEGFVWAPGPLEDVEVDGKAAKRETWVEYDPSNDPPLLAEPEVPGVDPEPEDDASST